MIVTTQLQDLEFFQSMSAEQISRIAAISSETHYPKDAFVQEENVEANALFFVKTGRVALQIDMPQNRKIVIDTAQPGDLFGWSAVVPPHVVTASSLCVEESDIIAIPREPFLALLNEDTKLRADVMEKICRIVASRLKDTRLQLMYLLGWG